MEIADKLVAGKGDARISVEDAGELFEKLATDDKYTDLEKDTISYLRKNYKWTKAGDSALRFAVRSWAAERSAAK